ncbi:adaptor protein MecA [uncultured Limosilactobacillus sp.]|uniref:adaptor protein MecA n=1 Tax=uncultured Limosilactobacillus sp. TaxID=2837629 RepID=UPI0025E16965|nr:adaptor protein MecA [uncultured Limosilactobacillus sp.]
MMEVNRLDDDTLQVIISQDDLEARGITMLDLMGDQHQIQEFFYQVLEEVDTENQFKDNDSVTFQVLQSPSGIELIISKNNSFLDNPELLQQHQEQLSKFLKKELQAHDRKTIISDHDDSSAEQTDEIESALNDPDLQKYTKVVSFADFEDFIELSRLADTSNLASDLYKYQDHYYLILTFFENGDLTSEAIRDRLGIVYEYANESTMDPMLLREHGQHVMTQAAFELARHYFA